MFDERFPTYARQFNEVNLNMFFGFIIANKGFCILDMSECRLFHAPVMT